MVGVHSRVANQRNPPACQGLLLPHVEQFYEALSDAQVLKVWFGEQLKRVGKVVREVEGEVGKLREEREKGATGVGGTTGGGMGMRREEVERLVDDAVRRESRMWQDEVGRLRAQIGDLQDALYATSGSSRTTGSGTGTGVGVGLTRVNGERERDVLGRDRDRERILSSTDFCSLEYSG